MLLLWIIGIALLEVVVSFAGQAAFFFGSARVKKYISLFISFAAGTLLGAVFLDILPEASRLSGAASVLKYALGGFMAFFILSRFLFWYHCHNGRCPVNGSPSVVLAGAAVHNFIDGAIIAFAFAAEIHLGLIAAFAILLHKIPKEMSDFFMLLHRGYGAKKALVSNFFAVSAIFAGAAAAYVFSEKMRFLVGPALGVAAGNFLYIAASDLIPGLNAERKKAPAAFLQTALILSGIFAIYAAGIVSAK